MKLDGNKVKVLGLWKKVATANNQARHFSFSNRYKEMRNQIGLIEEFIKDDSEKKFVAFWSKMDAAKQKANAKSVYNNNNADVLKDTISEMLEASEYKPIWEKQVKNARRSLWELFGRMHIDTVPILNKCTMDGLAFFGYETNEEYKTVFSSFLKFKEELYSKYVGHATKGTDHEVPINLEIDQLLNVIDKVQTGHIEQENVEDVKDLYRVVINYRPNTNFKSQKELRFKGFSERCFEILVEIEKHKTDTQFIKGILEEYKREVREPLWNLAQDLAKDFFTDRSGFITDKSIMSKIKGNGKEYKSNLWFGFYREDKLYNKKDYQYFAYLNFDGVKVGLYLGTGLTKDERVFYLKNAIKNADKICQIYKQKLKEKGFKFENEKGEEGFQVENVEDLKNGIKRSRNVHIVKSFPKDNAVIYSEDFSKVVMDIFKDLEQIYKMVTEGVEIPTVQLLRKKDFDNFKIGEELIFDHADRIRIEKAVSTALKQGKHIILTGPPGTGKTKLAKIVCKKIIGKENYFLTTATADWTTFDTIGGYMPKPGSGELEFRQGKFLDCFKDCDGNNTNKWLIIDEINRADIDKAFGQLFSVLAGDKVELPFRDLKTNKPLAIVPTSPHENERNDPTKYYVPKDWRLIGTMNTYDKTSLYEMSFAFMRRFAFIHIDTPSLNKQSIMNGYVRAWKPKKEPEEALKKAIFEIWKDFNDNSPRKIGPAIIEDIVKFSIEFDGDEGLTEAFNLYLLPQLEGMRKKEISDLLQIKAIKDNLSIERVRRIAGDLFKMDLLEKKGPNDEST